MLLCLLVFVLDRRTYACQRSLRSYDRVADFDEQFGIFRQEYVDSRAEFYETAHTVLFDRIAEFHVGDYASCDNTRNLAEQNFLALRRLDDGGGTFVLGR